MASPCRGILLDHVQKLEGDRVGLLDSRRRFIDVVRLPAFLPWEELRRLGLASSTRTSFRHFMR